MYIYKYVQSHIIILAQHVLATPVAIIRVSDNNNTCNILYRVYPCCVTPPCSFIFLYIRKCETIASRFHLLMTVRVSRPSSGT